MRPQKITEESFLTSMNPGLFFNAGTTVFQNFVQDYFNLCPLGVFFPWLRFSFLLFENNLNHTESITLFYVKCVTVLSNFAGNSGYCNVSLLLF